MSKTLQNDKLIREVVRKITSEFAPDKIILFGSHAHGRPDKDSDLDLLVVMDSPVPRPECDISVRKAIGPISVPVDVFTISPEEFDETKNVIGGIAYAPAKYGRIVYEKR
jgi:predicted nucleotidyltransferase